jgi:hypothetical protein
VHNVGLTTGYHAPLLAHRWQYDSLTAVLTALQCTAHCTADIVGGGLPQGGEALLPPVELGPRLVTVVACTALHCSAPSCIALHCTALHCSLHDTIPAAFFQYPFRPCL